MGRTGRIARVAGAAGAARAWIGIANACHASEVAKSKDPSTTSAAIATTSITSGATHHERHEHLERPHDQQDLQRREHQRAQQPRRARHVGEPVAHVHEQGTVPRRPANLMPLRDLSSCRDIPRVKGGVHVDESDGTDAELLERLASGDQRAMAVVFDRHAPAATRYAWAIAPSRMDVEEIVQDTFLTVWRKAAEIMIAEASLLPWLLVTCRNFGMNAVRKTARTQAEQFDDAAPQGGADVVREHHDAEVARDDLRWVLDEIERLEPIDRQVCDSAWSKACPTPRRPSGSTSASAQ